MISNQRYLTNTVKFIAALLVVNGHTFMYYSGMPETSRWLNLGAQCVSLFLLLCIRSNVCIREKRSDIPTGIHSSEDWSYLDTTADSIRYKPSYICGVSRLH